MEGKHDERIAQHLAEKLKARDEHVNQMREEMGGPFVTRLRSEITAAFGRNRKEKRALEAKRRKAR